MIRYAIAAAGLIASGAATSAVPAPTRYDIRLTLSENDAVLAAPRLVTSDGKPATFLSDDGQGNGWRAELIATPDAARPGQIAVDWSMTVTRALPDGTRSRRTMRTTLSLRDPGRALLDLPATADQPVMHVALDLATLVPRP